MYYSQDNIWVDNGEHEIVLKKPVQLRGSDILNLLIGQPEGLPNITGEFYARANEFFDTISGFVRVRDAITAAQAYTNKDTGAAGSMAIIDFNAARVNSIYGASLHVEPFYLTAKPWLRKA